MTRHDLTVSDLMSTALITVNRNDPVTGAHAEMQVGVVRHLPVVDERGRLVGLLSDRDLLGALGAKPPKKISDVMTRDIISVRPESKAHAAAALMLENKISSLPVVDEKGTLVGLVTQTDYLELARRALLGLPLER
jgi:CBS domain-containing protein